MKIEKTEQQLRMERAENDDMVIKKSNEFVDLPFANVKETNIAFTNSKVE